MKAEDHESLYEAIRQWATDTRILELVDDDDFEDIVGQAELRAANYIDEVTPHRWFVTFGVGTNLGKNYMLVNGATRDDVMNTVARYVGYDKTGAVRCAFAYPINELPGHASKFNLTEVPLTTAVYDRYD